MRLPVECPGFALSTLSSPVMGVGQIEAAARLADLSGIDLDLRSGYRLWRLGKFLPHLAETPYPAVTIWLPPHADRLRQVAVHVEQVPDDSSRPTVIVDMEPCPGPSIASNGLKQAIALHREYAGIGRIALAVHPRNPDGGRAHLSQLAAMRIAAEEWDFDLALDLSGQVDWLWEAEAAVYRMMPRLRIIRLTFPLPRFDAHVRTRMTQRVVAAAVDAGFSCLISIVVPLPPWRWWDTGTLAARAVSAVERLEDRFSADYGFLRRQQPQRSPLHRHEI